MSKFQTTRKYFVLFLVCLNIIAGLFYIFGFRVNLTPSIPIGIYRLSSESIGKGKYVVFNPTQSALFDEALRRGYLKKGVTNLYAPLFKKVCASGGDTINIDDSGISVNGRLLDGSKPLIVDNIGDKFPKLKIDQLQLSEDQLLLIGEVYNSFDSRYFGIVNLQNISSVIRTVYIW